MYNITNIWGWLGFSLFVVAALSLDTFFVKSSAKPSSSIRAAVYWTCTWIVCALIFNLILWITLDVSSGRAIANDKALAFFTGYLIEKSLSIDNLFAFYMIFTQLRIPVIYQQRVFTYGIWSAIVLRLVLILLGTWLVQEFHWVLYLMGAFLLLTGIKMLFTNKKQPDFSTNLIFRWVKQWLRVTPDLEEEHFFVRKKSLLYATPLFFALVLIEFTDVVFAFDSIPAIFAITTDPFIVWTSNIFAILGLRALYFLLARLVMRLQLLAYGIALILVFIGAKMMMAPWWKIPGQWSLVVIASLLVVFSLLSVWQLVKKGK